MTESPALQNEDSNKNSFNCHTCKKSFKHLQTMKKHIIITHEGKLFTCHICDYKVTRQEKIKSHVQFVHEGISIDCDKCDKKFRNHAYLRVHQRAVHEGIKLKCKLCDTECKYDSELRRHVRSIHMKKKDEKVKSFQCEHCDYVSDIYSHITTHMSGKHGEKKQCPKCDKSFIWTSYLKSHIQSEHENKRYTCDLCNKEFTYKGYLRKHKKVHHANSKHYCEKCPFYTKNIFSLKNHIKSKKCQKVSSTKTVINEHQIKENNQKMQRFTKEFSTTKDKIEDRTKELTDVNDFKCALCNYCTISKSFMEKHNKSFHSDQDMINDKEFQIQTFLCVFCDFTSSTTNDIQRHYLITHQDMEQETVLGL